MLLRYTALFRVLWLTGRYGGGKTSLALHLADLLIREGSQHRIATNAKLLAPWVQVGESDSFGDLMESGLQDACLIFDEGWLDLGTGASPRQVRQYLANLRKINCVLLVPSVLPLVRDLRVLTVEREFNAMTFGLPLWLYRYRLAMGTTRKGEEGRFWWWNPSRVFGWYDSGEVPGGVWRVYEMGRQVQSEARGSVPGDNGGGRDRDLESGDVQPCRSESVDIGLHPDTDLHCGGSYSDTDGPCGVSDADALDYHCNASSDAYSDS